MNRSLLRLRRGRFAKGSAQKAPRRGIGPVVTAPEAELRRLVSELMRLAGRPSTRETAVAVLAATYREAGPDQRKRLRRDMLALASGLQDVARQLRKAGDEMARRQQKLERHSTASRAYTAVATSSRR